MENKYNQYITCPICGTVFNLIRSTKHMNSKKCSYVQLLKGKTDLTLKEKLYLQILEIKNTLKYMSADNSGETG